MPFFRSACPSLLFPSLSAALTRGSGCSQLVMAELMVTWGQLLLASCQDRNEGNLLQLKEINVFTVCQKGERKRGILGWAGSGEGGASRLPSSPLQSPRETKVHSGAAHVS